MQSQNASNPWAEEQHNNSMNNELDEPFLDESDSDDVAALGGSFNRDQALPGDDPLDDNGVERTSFKRKQKQSAGGFGATLGIQNFFSRGSATPSDSPRVGTPLSSNDEGNWGQDSPRDTDPRLNTSSGKDGGSHDWIVEGPGRRVAYEDMTAIDWIFEYTKERQRRRQLYANAHGILGYIAEMTDASQVWIVLVVSGIAVGLIAAGIDIASDWLGDIKTGYCSAGKDGGRFYLNKGFCCMGYEEWSQCQDWVPWSKALHVTSTAGKWVVEYIFFIVFSVSSSIMALYCELCANVNRYYLRLWRPFWSRSMQSMLNIAEYQRSRRFLVASFYKSS